VPVIMFSFQPDLAPDQSASLLQFVQALDVVVIAGQLAPEATNPTTRRMHYAYLTQEADLDALIGKLQAMAEIETAFVPSESGL